MSRVAVLSVSSVTLGQIASVIGDQRMAGAVQTADDLRTLVLRHPITSVIVDLEVLSAPDSQPGTLKSLRHLFPSLGILVVADPVSDPLALFRIGREDVAGLSVVPFAELGATLENELRRAEANCANAQLRKALWPHLPGSVVNRVSQALHLAPTGCSVEAFTTEVGTTPTILQSRMAEVGLPTLGTVLTWGRLFHAAHWLLDPGRSAETVAEQVGYRGWSLRRALRSHLHATPTEVIARGGLTYALRFFIQKYLERMQPSQVSGSWYQNISQARSHRP